MYFKSNWLFNKLIVATNSNDILKRVIKTGVYKPTEVKHTVSPSMDIQVASNFERLVFDINSQDSETTNRLMHELKLNGKFNLTEENLKKISKDFCSESISEEETKSIINKVYNENKILIDPHTAIGIGAANKLNMDENIIVLATAHPYKFSDIVEKHTGIKPNLPENLKNVLLKKEKFVKLPNDLEKVKNYILERV